MGAASSRHFPRPLFEEGGLIERPGRVNRAAGKKSMRDEFMPKRRRTLRRHRPPTGLAFGEPDDRLRRTIQYAAAYRLDRWRLWDTGSPYTSRAMTGVGWAIGLSEP